MVKLGDVSERNGWNNYVGKCVRGVQLFIINIYSYPHASISATRPFVGVCLLKRYVSGGDAVFYLLSFLVLFHFHCEGKCISSPAKGSKWVTVMWLSVVKGIVKNRGLRAMKGPCRLSVQRHRNFNRNFIKRECGLITECRTYTRIPLFSCFFRSDKIPMSEI